jgi:Undecaprenyl-phosphate galactose phosphotransferase WbaP
VAAASITNVTVIRATSIDLTCKPIVSEMIFGLSDLVSINISAAVAMAIVWLLFSPAPQVGIHVWVLPASLPLFGLAGLYPAALSNPVQELKRVTILLAVSAAFAAAILARGPQTWPLLCSIAGSAAFAALILPFTRGLLRGAFSRQPWFGHPVFVFGSGAAVHDLVRNLQRNPQQGLKPVAVFAADRYPGDAVCDIPVLGPPEAAMTLAREAGVQRAIVATQPAQSPQELELMVRSVAGFSHVLFVPGVASLSTLHARVTEVSRAAAIEVSNRLAHPVQQCLKRCTDVAVTSLIAALVLPSLTIIALLIRLESCGPALYGHTRIGRNGRRFKVWKFRSMVTNGDAVLQQYLATNPRAAAEWASTQKLRRDPRITRIGTILRKTSLDELPQLWNILRGDMSLVGPRPVVQAELSRYSEAIDLYTRVRPGLTGLWQVSGRNNTTYEERVQLDSYYVRNWSFWLDIYVLAKTVRVVLLREGAY